MSKSQNMRLHLSIKGIVQGVGFRFFIYQLGIDLKLFGWVKNKLNGSVEILAEGPRDNLETLLGKAKKGPQMAQVINVDADWDLPKNDLPPFTIHPTDQ